MKIVYLLFLIAGIANAAVDPQLMSNAFYQTLFQMKDGFEFGRLFVHLYLQVPWKYFDIISALEKQSNSKVKEWLQSFKGIEEFSHVSNPTLPTMVVEDQKIVSELLFDPNPIQRCMESVETDKWKDKVGECLEKLDNEPPSEGFQAKNSHLKAIFLSQVCLEKFKDDPDFTIQISKQAIEVMDKESFFTAAPVLSDCLVRMQSNAADEMITSLLNDRRLTFTIRMGVLTSLASVGRLNKVLEESMTDSEVDLYKPMLKHCQPSALAGQVRIDENLIIECLKNAQANEYYKHHAITALLGKLSNDQKTTVSKMIFKDQTLSSHLSYILGAKFIGIFAGSDAISSDASFIANILSTDPSHLPQTTNSENILERQKIFTGKDYGNLNIDKEKWFVHGRTVHFPQKHLAFKFPKEGEDRNSLETEGKIQKFLSDLAQRDDRLKSNFPKNTEFYSSCNLPQVVRDKIIEEGRIGWFKLASDSCMQMLKFEVPDDYHKHLHQASSLRQLETGTINSLNDMAILASDYGLVSKSPADLFHNHLQQRAYFWDMDLAPPMADRAGAGKLSEYLKSVRFINISPSGLRDLKQFIVLSEYDNPRSLVSLRQVMSMAVPLTQSADFEKSLFMKKLGPKLSTLISRLGDFLLSWALSVLLWFKSHPYRPNRMKSWSDILKKGFVQFLSSYTKLEANDCESFLISVIKFDLMATQMEYFSSGRYAKDVRKTGKIASGIYRDDVLVAVKRNDEYFNSESPHLGPKNGALPLTELITAIYISVGFAVNLRNGKAMEPTNRFTSDEKLAMNQRSASRSKFKSMFQRFHKSH